MGGQIWALSVLALAAAALVRGTQMTLKGDETRCFTALASHGEKLTGSAEAVPDEHALRSMLYKVDSLTEKPKTIPVYVVIDNQFEFKVQETGYYSLCITNKSHGKNTVVFNYRVETGLNKDLSSVTTVEDTAAVTRFAELVLQNTHAIVDRTETYSSREQLYSAIIDDMNSRIIRWSVCQMIFLICICFFQIYYISSFFEAKSFV
ncbi:cop-coated vesicle membrane protein p24 precursor, putative [Babesia caballi]|uniref:Cop-coated vesicle membrane protein p24, putative n=1 Tax=Babesia caballi TaxID=5871 RepID=A0AAV4M1A6_BABCB|nr:cop-coated vesicle membrane protein p24 precursor, putative [Babesia caballi]